MSKREYIDLRSDTVTIPSAEMLEAMFNAEVGDDVFGEDPTVNLLEEKSAAIFGMEAGLFVPSGTMANQIAIRLNTNLQDEVICDKLSHIYYYEGGGTFSNSGVSIRLVDGDRGRINATQVVENINDTESNYLAVSSLVCIENTCNKGGGSYYTLNDIKEIGKVCKQNNLKFHIDGARIFNAVIETKEPTSEIGAHADTLSFCFSKGLGAPVGSMLVSSRMNINKARRIRKAFGGGMRQAGYLAAACLYSLDNNIERLKADHLRATTIGETLKTCSWVDFVMPVDTNIIVFRVSKNLSVKKIIDALYENGIKAVPFGKNDIRMVTHLNITDEMIDHILSVLPKLII
ncbi:MAG TPA: GntG family PLP-dependent aldolase [Bacteroidia bacterium]|nr:GntG family PLP-dependent aldolase [Bacteroidia bacterium]HNS13455.1 GntG family PLP-dependent aldolase [Bacteroidia bacterium]